LEVVIIDLIAPVVMAEDGLVLKHLKLMHLFREVGLIPENLYVAMMKVTLLLLIVIVKIKW